MAAITLTYTPADGSVLTLGNAGFNLNTWSQTSGQSIYGELNGELDAGNLSASFTLKPGSLRRADMISTGSGFSLDDQTISDRAFGDGIYSAADSDWIRIPAWSTRVYLSRGYDQVRYGVSGFMTALRQRESSTGNPGGGTPLYTGPNIYYRLGVDGTAIGHTQRYLPYSWYPGTNPGPAVTMTPREQCLGRHVNLSHLALGGGLVTAGWHECYLEVLLPRNTGIELLTPIGNAPTVLPADEPEHTNMHRLTLGVGSARIIAL